MKGSKLPVTGKMGNWPVIRPSGRISIEMEMEPRYVIAQNAWRNTYFLLAKLYGEEMGWEKTNEILGRMWGIIGHPEVFLALKKKYKEVGDDCVALSRVLQYEFLVEGYDIDVIEEKPEKAIIRELICPWWGDMTTRYQGVQVQEAMCGPGCIGIISNAAKAFNPQIKVERTMHIAKGDQYCEYVFTLKK